MMHTRVVTMSTGVAIAKNKPRRWCLFFNGFRSLSLSLGRSLIN